MNRFAALDSDTIETLRTWYSVALNEGQTYPSDEVLVDEMEQMLRSRMKAHQYVSEQYIRGCTYFEHGLDCHQNRTEHA